MNRLPALLFFCLLINTFQGNAQLISDVNFFSERQVMFASNKKLQITSARQAAEKVLNRYGGKVLKVSKKKVNGSQGYKVKLLKGNGQIISVIVDASSGRMKGS
jgi:hypothetical protein